MNFKNQWPFSIRAVPLNSGMIMSPSLCFFLGIIVPRNFNDGTVLSETEAIEHMSLVTVSSKDLFVIYADI